MEQKMVLQPPGKMYFNNMNKKLLIINLTIKQ